MLRNLAVAWSVGTLPVRALWKAYLGLAWAFDAPARPVEQRPAPSPADPKAATPTTPTTPGAPAPALAAGLPESSRLRLLKTGFTASTIGWAAPAYLFSLAQQHGTLSTGGAWIAFLWSALAAWVASLYLIRRAGKREAQARAASPLARAREAGARIIQAPARAATNVRSVCSRGTSWLRSRAPWPRRADAVPPATGA
jgi:hypothetical protein